MNKFQVTLSNDSPSDVWGEQALLTFSETIATIHLVPEGDVLRRIQKAARQLDSMGIPAVELTGDWRFEQQWAFALSYTRAHKPGHVTWCDNVDKQHLDNAYKALLVCRSWVNETPEMLSPENLANQAAAWLYSLAPQHVSYSKIVGEDLKSEGWVGTYEVGRGSERPPVMLTLDFNPSGDVNAPVDTVLVGKGITFDSGGYSIKTSQGMLDMKCDMAGAATITGALGLAIMQGLNKRVKLVLCCAENLISGHAYKLGDILTYKNGVTVEIVNTDAEGRLVLADGLIAAAQTGAPRVLNAATLTGAALNALGTDYHALFTNDPETLSAFFDSASKQFERFWQLPLEPWHSEYCPSSFADTANSRPIKGGGAGGASNAAGFLARFAPNKGWIHLDLAAAYHGNATSLMPAGATGKGVLTIADWLLK